MVLPKGQLVVLPEGRYVDGVQGALGQHLRGGPRGKRQHPGAQLEVGAKDARGDLHHAERGPAAVVLPSQRVRPAEAAEVGHEDTGCRGVAGGLEAPHAVPPAPVAAVCAEDVDDVGDASTPKNIINSQY